MTQQGITQGESVPGDGELGVGAFPDFGVQAELFAAFARGHYPIKRISQSQLTLNRGMLPKSTEIYVLTHPRPDTFGD